MDKKFKKSCVYYLNFIPSNWRIGKYKFFSSNRMGETILSSDLSDCGVPIYSATQEDKIFGYIEKPKFILKKGDLVIPARGNSIGYVSYINDEKATCTQTTICTYNIHNINNKFLFYCIKGLKDEWFRFDGSAIPQITVEQVKNNFVPIPSFDEQKKITNYLDDKVSKIDKFIEKTNKEIELIKEYRLNYITHLIDKYKNKSIIIRLRYLGNLINGISAGSDKFQNGNDTFINYGDVYNNITIPDNPVGKVNLTEKEKNIYSLKEGDILFTRTSETIEEVGFSSVCLKDYPNSAFSGFVIRFRPNNKYYMNPNFYKYYFKMREHRDFFAREMNLVTRASLSQNLLDNLPVCIFNKEIQDLLSSKLDKIYNITDNIIELKQNLIDKIEEYKKSLIYEVVTGKKEI